MTLESTAPDDLGAGDGRSGPGTGESNEDDPGSAVRAATTRLFRIVVGVFVIASFGVWVYAYSGQAARDAPDLFEDRALAADAEAVCAAALEDIDGLPSALDVGSGAERGDQIRLTTARYEQMLDELGRLTPGFERDDQIFRDWLADWRVMVADRLAYADAITVDENAQFLVTNTGVGERLDRRLTRLANTNSMTSCIAPTDLG